MLSLYKPEQAPALQYTVVLHANVEVMACKQVRDLNLTMLVLNPVNMDPNFSIFYKPIKVRSCYRQPPIC